MIENKKLKNETGVGQGMEINSLNTLAGGIAHNFNNLLMGIQGNAFLIISETDSDNPNYDRLRHIEELVQSGSTFVQQFLVFVCEEVKKVRDVHLASMESKSPEIQCSQTQKKTGFAFYPGILQQS